jgi:NAD(P)-dependent dehydrogenase (short-subunit alcohol dehydrogenase family)
MVSSRRKRRPSNHEGPGSLALIQTLSPTANLKETTMNLANRTILITGANRGLGAALVEEALRRGAKRIYAAARQPFTHKNPRVTPIILDVTQPQEIKSAAAKLASLDMVINNAGLSLYEDFSDRAMLDRHLAINLLGPYDLIQAVLPMLTRARGAIVNVLSLASLAPSPFNPSYSVSKAAAFSMSQAMRALLARQGVAVHVALPGPIDTDMTRDLEIPKASPASVACIIFDGVENGEDEIFPDPMSAAMAEGWRASASKALERQMASYVDAMPIRVQTA